MGGLVFSFPVYVIYSSFAVWQREVKFGATPSNAPGLYMVPHSGTTPGRFREAYRMLGMELGSAISKAVPDPLTILAGWP